jgi:EpsI family protein
VAINGVPLRVNRTIIEFGDQRQLVYYWFQQRGRVITNEFAVKWYIFLDSLTRHRTDGALVRLIVPLPRTMREEVADRHLTELSAIVAQSLTRYVPD